MSQHESHCPFLNRADYRCSNHFSLDKLGAAFDHCFGEYKSCATYCEMLSERQSRQGAELATAGQGSSRLSGAGLTGPVVYANLTVRTRPAHVTVHPLRLKAEHAASAA